MEERGEEGEISRAQSQLGPTSNPDQDAPRPRAGGFGVGVCVAGVRRQEAKSKESSLHKSGLV